jgi:hypothetical protein
MTAEGIDGIGNFLSWQPQTFKSKVVVDSVQAVLVLEFTD